MKNNHENYSPAGIHRGGAAMDEQVSKSIGEVILTNSKSSNPTPQHLVSPKTRRQCVSKDQKL